MTKKKKKSTEVKIAKVIHYKELTEEQNKTLTYLDEGICGEENYHTYEPYSYDGNLYIVYDGYADCDIQSFSKEFQKQLREYLVVE